MLEVLLDAISYMNGRKMIMLSMGRKGKQKAERKKKIESITGQIHDVIWKIQEVKSTLDALEKRAASAYDKAEDSGSDIHALVAHRNSL